MMDCLIVQQEDMRGWGGVAIGEDLPRVFLHSQFKPREGLCGS